ncbi:unnamed protein product [Moneuplotes crassus]|uniref:Uncharacterized protein n=1 Tax=Euplotes crassus TaxID=5936 RepID=A0AAD1X8X9_EUPCR|nr:unnamed protein product [Moneuplotes crassus]
MVLPFINKERRTNIKKFYRISPAIAYKDLEPVQKESKSSSALKERNRVVFSDKKATDTIYSTYEDRAAFSASRKFFHRNADSKIDIATTARKPLHESFSINKRACGPCCINTSIVKKNQSRNRLNLLKKSQMGYKSKLSLNHQTQTSAPSRSASQQVCFSNRKLASRNSPTERYNPICKEHKRLSSEETKLVGSKRKNQTASDTYYGLDNGIVENPVKQCSINKAPEVIIVGSISDCVKSIPELLRKYKKNKDSQSQRDCRRTKEEIACYFNKGLMPRIPSLKRNKMVATKVPTVRIEQLNSRQEPRRRKRKLCMHNSFIKQKLYKNSSAQAQSGRLNHVKCKDISVNDLWHLPK